MSVVRVVFLGTPEFSCTSLQMLVNDDHYEVVGVVTQPDRKSGRKMQLKPCPVKTLALEHNLPVISPESVNSSEVIEQIESWKAEAAIVVAFGQIVSQKFLDLFPQKVVNVHASLLPRWRGAAPIQRAIMAGDKETGVALQVMVKKLDAGDVIGSRKIALDEQTDAQMLHDKLAILGADLLHVEFMDYLRGNLVAIPQDESLVTLASKIDKSESSLDFSLSAQVIHRKVLGLTLGPGTFTNLGDQKLKIHKTSYSFDAQIDSAKNKVHGQILSLGTSIEVQCGQGVLVIYEIQPESRPKMPVSEFLKGHKLKIGQVFGC